MRTLLFILDLFVCSSVFAQGIDRAFFEDNPNLGGDVLLKSANYEVIGEEIRKTFEMECFEDGYYYMDAWINIPMYEGKYVEYKITVNGEVTGFTFKAQRPSWQGLALTNAENSTATVRLKKGTNRISVIGKLPIGPPVEFVKLSLNISDTGISDKKYRKFVEKIRTNSFDDVERSELSPTSSDGDTNSAGFRGTGGEIYDYAINMQVYYTSYFYFYGGNQTMTINVNTNSRNYFKVDIFQIDEQLNPYYSSYGIGNTIANMNLYVSKTDGYVMRICSPYDPTGMEVDLCFENYWFYATPVTGSGMNMSQYNTDTASFYTCKVKDGGYPWLILEDCCDYPLHIAAHNNFAGYSSDGYYWGRANKITTPYRIYKAYVSSYYSYNADFECDLYMNLRPVSSQRLSQFPGLAADNCFMSDSIQRVPFGSTAYNCVSWSVSLKDSVRWPSYTDVSKWDDFFSYYHYTNVGATADNAAIALWKEGNLFTHTSVRKHEFNPNPHGFEWESVMGDGNERVMHTRDALAGSIYGSIVRYYKPIHGTLNYSPSLRESNEDTFTHSQAVLSTLPAPDFNQVCFDQSELDLIDSLSNLIPANTRAEFYSLYLTWTETWGNPEIVGSGPYSRAKSTEYYNLLNFCLKYDKALIPLIIDIIAQREYYYTLNLIKDMTYFGSIDFLDYIYPSPSLGIFYPISVNIVNYCKKLLKDEKDNILRSINDITGIKDVAFITNAIVINNQKIFINLYSENTETAFIKIYNISGILGYESNCSVPKGGRIIVINVSGFNNGIYVLQITIGDKKISQKINL